MKPLTPIRFTRHPKYDYVLTEDLRLRSDKYLGTHDFMDEMGRVWMEVRGHSITIKKGYSWDGASMAPDFPDVVLASCFHDCGIQFLKVPCFPMTKSEVDEAFRKLMPQRFVLRWVYWGAVRAFGGIYSALATHNPRTVSCGLPHRK